MVYINANLDQNTNKILRTGYLTETLGDLCEETLYVTFVARKKNFIDAAWREENDHFIRVVLPYQEVLQTENINLLASRRLFQQLPLLNWLEVEMIKKRLQAKMAQMQ